MFILAHPMHPVMSQGIRRCLLVLKLPVPLGQWFPACGHLTQAPLSHGNWLWMCRLGGVGGVPPYPSPAKSDTQLRVGIWAAPRLPGDSESRLTSENHCCAPCRQTCAHDLRAFPVSSFQGLNPYTPSLSLGTHPYRWEHFHYSALAINTRTCKLTHVWNPSDLCTLTLLILRTGWVPEREIPL